MPSSAAACVKLKRRAAASNTRTAESGGREPIAMHKAHLWILPDIPLAGPPRPGPSPAGEAHQENGHDPEHLHRHERSVFRAGRLGAQQGAGASPPPLAPAAV